MTSAAVHRHALIVALAVFTWSGVMLQAVLSLHVATLGGKSIAAGAMIFLSYFTVLTNLLVCITLTLPLVARESLASRFLWRPGVAAGVATSILFVGLAYHFLLRTVWSPQGLQLVCDWMLHYATPLFFMTYWWFCASKSGLSWRHPFIWGLYPTAYLAYALLLGAMSGKYAYGFIDAGVIGYQRTVLNGLALLLAFIVLGLLVVACGRSQGSR